MYDINSPAEDINELFEYLKREDSENYCYRGQTQEYDYLVPSLYRKYIKSKKSEINEISINDDLSLKVKYGYLSIDATIDQNDIRTQKKVAALRRLVKEFGSAIGNILAQQYGINSECIDVTSDLEVACFFATRDWPTYDITKKGGLGVIYRFKVNNGKMSCASYDMRKKMSYEEKNKNIPYLLSFMKERLTIEELNDLSKTQKFDKKVEVASPFILLNYKQIRYIFDTYKKSTKNVHFMFDYLYASRWSKQRGGILLPARYFNGSVDSGASPKELPPSGILYMNPPCVIYDKMIGIDDSSKYSFVEKFYFKQKGCCLKDEKLTREYLWPSLKEDSIFYAITLMECLANDIEDFDEIFDVKNGIIDRGYYD